MIIQPRGVYSARPTELGPTSMLRGCADAIKAGIRTAAPKQTPTEIRRRWQAVNMLRTPVRGVQALLETNSPALSNVKTASERQREARDPWRAAERDTNYGQFLKPDHWLENAWLLPP